MDFGRCLSLMETNAQRLRALAEGVSVEQARWRPTPDSWSILEVINHLADEETEDFRALVDRALHRPDDKRPPIDPQGWVTQRKYNERDLEESLTRFLAERESSLAWLRKLSSPDWEGTYEMPWGPMRAGDAMAAWVAHDMLHLRQLVKLHWAYAMPAVEPYSVQYAGDW